jgi:GrpB-like predicted nucleotidyltransferase (UPF0157 family)
MPEKVMIFPYNPKWQEEFSRLGAALRSALGNTAIRIDHIGSTSVPGLDAKPVVDIQISVKSFTPEDPYQIPLDKLGYFLREDNTDKTELYFREKPGGKRTHIHIAKAGSWSEQTLLLFRDYLRVHPYDAKRYAKLKYKLAEKYQDDRPGYTNAKTSFVWSILKKAAQWSKDTGWEPGPSDA